MSSATKQKLKKRTSPAKKISRISNTLRPLHRKKLTALNLRLRRPNPTAESIRCFAHRIT